MDNGEVIWEGRSCILGSESLPSKNHYTLRGDSLIIKSGYLSSEGDTVKLYRIMKVRTRQGLSDKLLGVGDIEIYTSNVDDPQIVLEKIKNVDEVRDLIDNAVDESRLRNKVRVVDEGLSYQGERSNKFNDDDGDDYY